MEYFEIVNSPLEYFWEPVLFFKLFKSQKLKVTLSPISWAPHLKLFTLSTLISYLIIGVVSTEL